ncbi:DUF362 domain-containing protein [Candidatus Woesearchaeota archaeon]|nr:DUF362 domain-containing protein [Candidatus Woesearchaeota archaeon]
MPKAKSQVAVVKTSPKTVLDDYKKVMQLADYKKFLPKDKELVLKLNLSWSLYFPACSTEPWQLEGVLKTLIKDGYKKIHPVENRTVVTDVWKGAKGNKWLPILEKYGQKFEPLTETKWVPFKPKSTLLALDKIFPEDYRIPEMFLGKSVLHMPSIKTHGHTTTTGAMKNAFGGLITMKRHHCHKMIHEVLVDLLMIQKEIHTGMFAVMDGAVAGDGNGPRTMIPRIANTLLASGDQVAIDAVAAKMMGFDPFKIKYLKLAHDLGLGCADVDQMEIVGEDISKVNFHFSVGKSPVIFFDQLFRTKMNLQWLFHTRLFKLCVFGSEFYHDKIWYPTKGKRIINHFMKTEWGKLWKEYP